MGAIIASIVVGLSLILASVPEARWGWPISRATEDFSRKDGRGMAFANHHGHQLHRSGIIASPREKPRILRLPFPARYAVLVWRLILFYVLAIAVMVTMVPWNQGYRLVNPFWQPFRDRIRCGAHTFRCGDHELRRAHRGTFQHEYQPLPLHRMLFLLGRGGYAPEWMGKVSRNGVPHRALLASTAGIVAAILLAIFAPRTLFSCFMELPLPACSSYGW